MDNQELLERAEKIKSQITDLQADSMPAFSPIERGVHLALLTAHHAMRTVVALAGQERVERKQKDYIVKKCTTDHKLIEVISDPGLKDMFRGIEGIEHVTTIFENKYRLWVDERYDFDTMFEHIENVLNMYFSGLVRKES